MQKLMDLGGAGHYNDSNRLNLRKDYSLDQSNPFPPDRAPPRRLFWSSDRRYAHLGDGSMQFSVPVLYAGGRIALAGQRKGAD